MLLFGLLLYKDGCGLAGACSMRFICSNSLNEKFSSDLFLARFGAVVIDGIEGLANTCWLLFESGIEAVTVGVFCLASNNFKSILFWLYLDTFSVKSTVSGIFSFLKSRSFFRLTSFSASLFLAFVGDTRV